MIKSEYILIPMLGLLLYLIACTPLQTAKVDLEVHRAYLSFYKSYEEIVVADALDGSLPDEQLLSGEEYYKIEALRHKLDQAILEGHFSAALSLLTELEEIVHVNSD